MFSHAQTGIVFYEGNFETALDRAKKEGKDIFLDSYAPWCKPCKKMDRIFASKKVGAIYNKNFINVKVNVDRVKGKEVAEQYGIVFLPTMLIIDQNGYVKTRIDGLMSEQQIIQVGESMADGGSLPIAESIPQEEIVETVADGAEIEEGDDDEKILFVLNDPSAKNNPEYLYYEALFRLEQMDGSHDSIAERYLGTQEDWSSEKNLQFIVDFMDDTDSKLFSYFTENPLAFQNLMGADKYRNTLDILIHNCLYRQIPRPTEEKVLFLYSLLYPRKAEKYTHQYLLQRYEEEERFLDYVRIGESYLESLIQADAEVLYKVGKYKGLEANQKVLKECVFRVEESIRLSEHPNFDQFLTLAKLSLRQGKERKAMEYATQAKTACLGDTAAQREVDQFIAQLDKS